MIHKYFNFVLFSSFITIFFVFFNSCDDGPTEPDRSEAYHNKILFTSSRSGKEQLYMMNPDGTNIKQITSGEYAHFAGRWSPDASRIVAKTDENLTTAGSYMVVMSSDGTNRVILSYGSQMSWQPDGNKILFTHCPSCEIGIFNMKLYRIEPNGNNLLVLSEEYAGETAFSPTGEEIAYVYSNISDSIPKSKIVILDYPTFENAKIIGPAGAVMPAWSPDGKEFVFAYKESNSNQNYTIAIMKTDGSVFRKIITNISDQNYFYPRWSDDGKKIIFLGFSVNETKYSQYIYIVNKDGTDLKKIIDDSSVTSCDWSK